MSIINVCNIESEGHMVGAKAILNLSIYWYLDLTLKSFLNIDLWLFYQWRCPCYFVILTQWMCPCYFMILTQWMCPCYFVILTQWMCPCYFVILTQWRCPCYFVILIWPYKCFIWSKQNLHSNLIWSKFTL